MVTDTCFFSCWYLRLGTLLTSNRLCINRAKKAKEPQSQNNKIKIKKNEKKIKCLKINLDQLKKII